MATSDKKSIHPYVGQIRNLQSRLDSAGQRWPAVGFRGDIFADEAAAKEQLSQFKNFPTLVEQCFGGINSSQSATPEWPIEVSITRRLGVVLIGTFENRQTAQRPIPYRALTHFRELSNQLLLVVRKAASEADDETLLLLAEELFFEQTAYNWLNFLLSAWFSSAPLPPLIEMALADQTELSSVHVGPAKGQEGQWLSREAQTFTSIDSALRYAKKCVLPNRRRVRLTIQRSLKAVSTLPRCVDEICRGWQTENGGFSKIRSFSLLVDVFSASHSVAEFVCQRLEGHLNEYTLPKKIPLGGLGTHISATSAHARKYCRNRDELFAHWNEQEGLSYREIADRWNHMPLKERAQISSRADDIKPEAVRKAIQRWAAKSSS